MNIDTNKYIYHLTSKEHIKSILEHGLLSRNLLREKNISFNDIANQDIIEKRHNLEVDNYVPFHFYPYSPFDAAVKSTYPDTDFIYICVQRTVARENGFVISPIHPVSGNAKVYPYDVGFKKIDWNTMNTYGVSDEYSKHVKMAECLCEDIVDISLIHSIGVATAADKREIERYLREYDITDVFVDVRDTWF